MALANRQKVKGFTLVEVIVVLAIISILYFSLQLDWIGSTYNLAAQANQFANDIRLAQTLSMSRDQRYRLVITSSNTYRILNESGTPIMFGLGSTTMTLSPTITFGSVTNLPNNLVAFNSLGVPYTDTAQPGTALASTGSIVLVGTGATRTIVITPNTGRVSIQ